MIVALDQFEWQPDAGPGGGYWRAPEGCRGMIDLASFHQISEARPGQPRGWLIARYDEIPAGLFDRGGVILGGGDIRDARPDGGSLDAWESLLGYRPGGDTLEQNLFDHLTTGADPANEDRTGMIVPTLRGELEIGFGPGTLLRRERFRFGSHPHARKLRALLVRQLAEARRLAHSGSMFNPLTGSVDWDYDLRIADALCEKYVGLDPKLKAELFDEFKRSLRWPRGERLLPHATVITETFDQADSATLGPNLTWNKNNAWSTVSNQLTNGTSGSSCRARAETDLSGADHYGQIQIIAHGSTGSGTRGIGAIARYSSSALTHYYALRQEGASFLQLWKSITSTRTQIGTNAAITVSLPNTIRCECQGSTITGKWDGATIYSQTDTAIDGVSVGGLRCGVFALTNTTFALFDNFEAGDLTASSPTYPQLERGIRGLERGLCTGMRF